MRDIVLVAIVMAGCIASLKRPWIGIMLWTWLSIMNPHRYTYGFAYSAPLAAAAAAAVMVGLLMTKERESPFKGAPVVWFVAFIAWVTISWLFGLDIKYDYDQWKKVMKIDVLLLIALMLLHTKQHVFALMWVCAISIGFLAIKGGIFTIATGGGYRVWGPPGSFIGNNNEFSLAVIMTIPLLRFLQLQMPSKLVRLAFSAAIVLCAASALGSYSRGAFLATVAMVVVLWWRSRKKFGLGVLLLIALIPLLYFMPVEWYERMATIDDYQDDRSAMGRISAWWTAWNIALNHITGVGFNAATAELFAKYSPYPDYVHAAHSIYFQVMGNHGFIGLFIFLGIWISTWRSANWLRKRKNITPETQWAADLAAMCQVSLVGYAVGGAFLSLSYFDLPYNIMLMVVITRVWVEKQKWKTEPEYKAGWLTIPGLATRHN